MNVFSMHSLISGGGNNILVIKEVKVEYCTT